MSPRALARLTLLVVLGLVPPEPAAAQPKPARLDADGRPLPTGALARLGTARFRHRAALAFLGFTGRQQVLALATDGDLRLWDAATGKQVRQFPALPPT